MSDSDAVSSAIGDVGRYQVTRFILVLLVSVPGLCHIFAVIFSTVKTDYWCADFPLSNDTKMNAWMVALLIHLTLASGEGL